MLEIRLQWYRLAVYVSGVSTMRRDNHNSDGFLSYVDEKTLLAFIVVHEYSFQWDQFHIAHGDWIASLHLFYLRQANTMFFIALIVAGERANNVPIKMS